MTASEPVGAPSGSTSTSSTSSSDAPAASANNGTCTPLEDLAAGVYPTTEHLPPPEPQDAFTTDATAVTYTMACDNDPSAPGGSRTVRYSADEQSYTEFTERSGTTIVKTYAKYE